MGLSGVTWVGYQEKSLRIRMNKGNKISREMVGLMGTFCRCSREDFPASSRGLDLKGPFQYFSSINFIATSMDISINFMVPLLSRRHSFYHYFLHTVINFTKLTQYLYSSTFGVGRHKKLYSLFQMQTHLKTHPDTMILVSTLFLIQQYLR